MKRSLSCVFRSAFATAAIVSLCSLCRADEPLFTKTLNVEPRPIAADPSVKYDYDIVYVRARRAGDKVH